MLSFFQFIPVTELFLCKLFLRENLHKKHTMYGENGFKEIKSIHDTIEK